MGIFLNSKAPYETYTKLVRNPYFVDKSLLLAELEPSFGSINCYCCITRPRRFGKTVMTNMIGAFFGKTDKKTGFLINWIFQNRRFMSRHTINFCLFRMNGMQFSICRLYLQKTGRNIFYS